MTYQEKVARAEECYHLILKGQSFLDITMYLEKEGLTKTDISKVISSVQNFILESYESIVKSEYDSLYNFLTKWKNTNLTEDVFNFVQNNFLEKHKSEKKIIINQMLRNNSSLDWIIDQVEDVFFSTEEITSYVERHRAYFPNYKEITPSDSNRRNKGLSFIFFGIFLFVGFLMYGRISFIGIGITIAGIILLFFENHNNK
jgi:hypothetical protein